MNVVLPKPIDERLKNEHGLSWIWLLTFLYSQIKRNQCSFFGYISYSSVLLKFRMHLGLALTSSITLPLPEDGIVCSYSWQNLCKDTISQI